MFLDNIFRSGCLSQSHQHKVESCSKYGMHTAKGMSMCRREERRARKCSVSRCLRSGGGCHHISHSYEPLVGEELQRLGFISAKCIG
jgi:hypothetical protein